MLVDGANMNEKIGGGDFYATRKMDGIMQVIFVSDGEVSAYSSGGNATPVHLPCMKELSEIMRANGITNAIMAAELYATISRDGRERVCDVATALADESLHGQLQFALFDVMELDGKEIEVGHYKEKIETLRRIFAGGRRVRPVPGKSIDSKADLIKLYESVVCKKNAEGIVVHNDSPIIYKVKPRHSIDAVIIGYTVGEDTRSEMVRDILVAVMHPDGTLRQVASTGTGLSDDDRVNFYAQLSSMHVPSDYIETDSRNVAYQMVRPDIVVEISAVDYVTENASGEAKKNMLLSYSESDGYAPIGRTSGCVLHSPVFLRVRSDKSVTPEDIRLSQLTDLCSFANDKPISVEALPKSEILSRRVFHKHVGFKRMVQKFVVWKTNKEHTGDYPAYVLHHTDYNYSRNEQLRRDIKVSNSREQIMSLLDEMILVNIKKGWEEII